MKFLNKRRDKQNRREGKKVWDRKMGEDFLTKANKERLAPYNKAKEEYEKDIYSKKALVNFRKAVKELEEKQKIETTNDNRISVSIVKGKD